MTKTVALLLGAMVVIAAFSGSVRAAEGQAELGYSLPIGVTGPPTCSLDRLHTVPRLPPGSGEVAGGPASSHEAPVVAVKPEAVIKVSQ